MMLAYLGMACSAWIGVLAIDPNNGASWVGGAAALTLLTIAIGFNARNQVNQTRELKSLRKAQRRDQRVCNYQISVLVGELEQKGMTMPPEFWDIPDDLEMEKQEQRDKKRRRIFGVVDESEDGEINHIFLGTIMLILAMFAIFSFVLKQQFIDPLNEVKATTAQSALENHQDSCVASLTADYFVAVQRALAAPPAPNPEREAAVKDLGVTAERIRHRVPICEDGKPDDYQPTPATTPTKK